MLGAKQYEHRRKRYEQQLASAENDTHDAIDVGVAALTAWKAVDGIYVANESEVSMSFKLKEARFRRQHMFTIFSD